MLRFAYLILLLMFLAPVCFAQAPNPGDSVERARIDEMNNRLKGKDVIASDETLRPGRTYDFVEIQKKTIELNHLIQDVNGDVVKASKGVMSADMNKRLKRIEKLAKEIRQAFE